MILYFDTETTGLYPGQICQLSYVMQTKNSISAKNFFFTVDSMEYGAFMVHGFSIEKLNKLSNGKRFEHHFNEIEKDFLSASVLVSHNTAFDFSFMRNEFERLGETFFVKDEFCTMKNATPVCKILRSNGKSYKYPKLSELTCFLGISDQEILNTAKRLFGAQTGYHDARFDTSAVYLISNTAFDKYKEFAILKEYL